MLFVPSAAAKHHHHRLPEQLNSLQTSAIDDAKKTMPLKFNVKKTAMPCPTTATTTAATTPGALVKEAVVGNNNNNNNNNHQVDTLVHKAVVKQQSAEIVEAMRKLDAKLVAYLSAADNDNNANADSAVDNKLLSNTGSNNNNNNNNNHGVIINVGKCALEHQHQQHQQQHQHVSELPVDKEKSMPSQAITHLIENCGGEKTSASTLLAAATAKANANYHRHLEKFRRVNALKLQMEALTLQPDGIKYMDMLQTEIRPIFTVECQLSHELIRHVPRSEMFHVMQFESGKFQSLTQCTRFGQEAQRAVRLQLHDHAAAANDCGDGNGDDVANVQLNIGRIRFAVWWREPGTCINEMLGIGVLELAELYEVALLEQCMSVKVCKRGVHFGSLYFKISLLLQCPAIAEAVKQQLCDPFDNRFALLSAAVNGDLDDDDENGNGNGNGNGNDGGNAEPQQQQQQQQNNNKSMNNQQQASGNGDSGGSGTDAKNIAAAAGANDAAVNNSQLLESSQFNVETSQVRLLKGFLYANETRNLTVPSGDAAAAATSAKCDYILVCRRFWQDEAAATAAGEDCAFNYQEQFSIINDQSFLQSVHKRHLQLELWRRSTSDSAAEADDNDDDGAGGNDDNGNPRRTTSADSANNVEPFGLVRLPLHHFFIAYRDAAIANHICKGRMPVISIDAWVPIQQPNNAADSHIGELKCLLAIGSEEQISHLKATRGFSDISKTPLSPIKHFSISKTALNAAAATTATGNTPITRTALSSQSALASATATAPALNPNANREHAKLLDMLQQVLNKRITPTPEQRDAAQTLMPSPPAPPPAQPAKSYQLLLDVREARNLPYNTVKRKKGAKRRNGNGGGSGSGSGAPTATAAAAAKRCAAGGGGGGGGVGSAGGGAAAQGEAPTCYVTFQADACVGQSTYKSHEGQVYATNVVENCCQPKWDAKFRLSVNGEYLSNSQKCFVLKVWRKTAQSVAASHQQSRPLQPTPMDDAIVGFVALDLTAFRRGATHIDGWFNIIDFNGRVNGQLDVRCATQLTSPSANFAQKQNSIACATAAAPSGGAAATASTTTADGGGAGAGAGGGGGVDAFIDQFEHTLDLTHLNIGQAIKRKYTELEGISQRLRTRLADITGENLSQPFDMDVLNDWQPPDVMAAELLNDTDWDEFEHDISTTPPPMDVSNISNSNTNNNNNNNQNSSSSSCSGSRQTSNELNANTDADQPIAADSTITAPEAEHGE